MTAPNSPDDDVRFNVQMPRRLRDDAKRDTDHGELSAEIRDLFRRIAYGGTGGSSELDRVRSELDSVRDHIDDLRRQRRKIDAEIESKETRATRLEERIEKLESKSEQFDTTVETLEKVLLDGSRVFPNRIDDDLDASRVIEELKERNPDVPDHAFRLAKPHEPNNWRDAEIEGEGGEYEE